MNRKYPMVGPSIIRTVMSRLEKGSLRPGDRIMPRVLGQRLRTSATPVREALCMLVGRDVLVERHREGFYVASVTSATLRALYAAHGRVMEDVLSRHLSSARLEVHSARLWPLFAVVAASIDDDALTGMQRYLAGRLAVAHSHEATHAASPNAARDLITALRAGNIIAAVTITRSFHEDCAAASQAIWQSMTDR